MAGEEVCIIWLFDHHQFACPPEAVDGVILVSGTLILQSIITFLKEFII